MNEFTDIFTDTNSTGESSAGESVNDFFTQYLHAVRGSEVPTFFHRWSIITAIGAWLGRDTWLEKGAFKVYPNMYTMLLGSAGTKKSTAIKRAKKFLAQAGYDSFSAEKTTKEKFLLDLDGADAEEDIDGFLDIDLSQLEYAQCFIAADEFNDFFGNNILEFVALLGVLWDYEGVYKSKIKNGVSVEIPDPTISILGGNTQTTFANTFPPEIVGQGFFSRLVAIYAEPTSRKITWPREPTDEEKKGVCDHLVAMKTACAGAMEITDDAADLVDKIYTTWEPLEDDRFASYGNRRLMHLLKLCVIHAATRLSMVIETQDVTYANTILTHAEHFMPKAFGEFGMARNASVGNKVINIVEAYYEPVAFDFIWSKVSNDLDDVSKLSDIMRGLVHAGKVQVVESGFLACRKPLDVRHDELVDYKYLTDAEINGE